MTATLSLSFTLIIDRPCIQSHKKISRLWLMFGKSWGSTFEQQATGAESHDKSPHILSQKFIGRTSKLSLWAKIVGHLNHSRWWWPDLDHKVPCPTCPAWVPDPPCVGKALSDLTLFFAPLFGTNTLYNWHNYPFRFVQILLTQL